MIIKHIIPITLRDTYTLHEDVTDKEFGRLIIYKHSYVVLFGDSQLN